MRLALVLLAFLASCAAPAAEQGRSAQGGSVGPTSPVTVTITIGGSGAPTTITGAPTAAPASASTATAEQKADAKVDAKLDAALGDSAIEAATGANKIPKLGGEKAPVPAPVVEPPK